MSVRSTNNYDVTVNKLTQRLETSLLKICKRSKHGTTAQQRSATASDAELPLRNLLTAFAGGKDNSATQFLIAYDPAEGFILRYSSSGEIEELHLQRAPLDTTAFRRILPNCDGKLVALVGDHCVSVVILPTNPATTDTSRAVHLSERYLATSTDVHIVDVHWLPLRCFGDSSRLAVLSSDQLLRIYDLGRVSAAGGNNSLSEPVLQLSTNQSHATLSRTTISIDKPVSFAFISTSKPPLNTAELDTDTFSTAMPFEMTSTYEFVILSEQGEIRLCEFRLDLFHTSNKIEHSPSLSNSAMLKNILLAVYPASDELYGLYACSIRVLSFEPHVVLAVAMQTGRIYHALLARLPQDETDEEFDLQQDETDVEQAVFLIDCVDLDLSSSNDNAAGNGDNDNCALELLTFPTVQNSNSAYLIRSVCGMHAVQLPWLSLLLSDNNNNDGRSRVMPELNSVMGGAQLPKAVVEYLCCWDERKTPSFGVFIQKQQAAVEMEKDSLYELTISLMPNFPPKQSKNPAESRNFSNSTVIRVPLPWYQQKPTVSGAEKRDSVEPRTSKSASSALPSTNSITFAAIQQILSNKPSIPTFDSVLSSVQSKSSSSNNIELLIQKFITTYVDNLTVWAGQLRRARDMLEHKARHCRLSELKFADAVETQLEQKREALAKCVDRFEQTEQQFEQAKTVLVQRIDQIDSTTRRGRHDLNAHEVEHAEKVITLREKMRLLNEKLSNLKRKLEYYELRCVDNGDEQLEEDGAGDEIGKNDSAAMSTLIMKLLESNRQDLNLLQAAMTMQPWQGNEQHTNTDE